MSKDERHEKFRQNGWVLRDSVSIFGFDVEAWEMPDGSAYYWSPFDEGMKPGPIKKWGFRAELVTPDGGRQELDLSPYRTRDVRVSDWLVKRLGYPPIRARNLHELPPDQNVAPIIFYGKVNRCAARRSALASDFDRTYAQIMRVLSFRNRPFTLVDETPDWLIYGMPSPHRRR